MDGNDLRRVVAASREAVERARSGRGPTLLECRTYRHHGHSKSDPGHYRPNEEVDSWLEHDPLALERDRLLAGATEERELAALEEAVHERLDQAVEAALAAPFPDPDHEAGGEYLDE